jgi:hypothetical protein
VGTCIYCGKPAGLFSNKHQECVEKRNRGWAEMVNLAKAAAMGGGSEGFLEKINDRLVEIAKGSFISPDQLQKALVAGWEQAVSHFIEDGNLDCEEEDRLTRFAEHFAFTQEDLDKNGAYTQFVKGAVLRELMEGKVPSRFHPGGRLPFNFQKSEALIWVFNNVAYLEEKTRRQYVGGSHGMSFRIAKGVYYRVGSFRGRPVETTEVIGFPSRSRATNFHSEAGAYNMSNFQHQTKLSCKETTGSPSSTSSATGSRITGDT